MKQHYTTLGLQEGASQDEIQAAYKRLSKELDPANNDNQEFFIEEFALLQEAYTAITGEIPQAQNKIDTKASEVLDLFEESDTIVSILKRFKTSENATKIEIIKSLEAFKTSNQTYQQALALLYKKEDIDSLQDTKEKQIPPGEVKTPSTKQSNKQKSVKKPSSGFSAKSKKIAVVTLLSLTLLFGGSYLYFLTKVTNFESQITTIVEESQYQQNISKTVWETKFFENYPEITAKHLTDNTNKGFLYKETDRSFIKDTVVRFFIFSESFSIKLYKPEFFECVYYNAINADNYWNHYIVDQQTNDTKNILASPYLDMSKKIKQKHKISDNEFDELLNLVGGLQVFQTEKPSKTDFKCAKCIQNYTNTYETNTLAINDFYEFVSQYLVAKKRIEKSNKAVLAQYNIAYKKQTSGMSKSLRSKLNVKIKEEPALIEKEVSQVFSGFKEGLGELFYSFKQYDTDFSTLKEYVSNIYTTFYKTNTLYTGATPYRYCYGKNPYCYPPDGYNECSFIDIKASSSSDVVVLIKKNNNVYAHAYIKAGGYYKFKLGNGSFQAFFYYGNGWNPKKFIKNANCGSITGGFVSDETLDKSDVIRLYNSSMTYTLYTVENGNFKPKASSKNEAF